ncbi:MAG: bifunctional oligoribonuclease/PAP phosphatase NrnA [Elusimicrobia bacterium]|nr:bifunctional oligoribonuclease/PAP phosphatase NrnA [Elusimicrobiota bacterium]
MRSLDPNDIRKFKHIIDNNKTFFLTLHTGPDADAAGSMLVVYEYLKSLKKTVYLYSVDSLPENLHILPHYKSIKNSLIKKEFDVAIFFECSTPDRAGININDFKFKRIINIDHHRTAERYGDVNILNFDSPSTAEMIWNIFKHLKIKITKNMAVLLYSGIITDTGKFHYSQTTPETHIIAAELLKYKFNFTKINDNFFLSSTYQSLKLLGRALESLKIKDGIAFMNLTQNDFKEFDASFEHSESIVNYPMMIDEVKVSVFIKEDEKKFTVTFRSKPKINVSNVALAFNGGGHKNASGFKISKEKITYDELKRSILTEIKKEIK